MRRNSLFAFAAVPALLAAAPALAHGDETHPAEIDAEEAAATFDAIDQGDEKFEFVNQYCVECHNFTDWAGGIAFDTMSMDMVAEDAAVWEHAVEKLRGSLMPPISAEAMPDDAARYEFVGWMESYLDHVGGMQEWVGHVPLHRLNRKEYANAIRDLLGIEVEAEALLPQDASADGFDNIAEALNVSPSFLEQSLNAARTVAAQAIGDPNARTGGAVYNVTGDSGDQETHVEGLPLGTRGGMAVEHYFPADGEYVLNIGNLAQRLWVANQEFTHTVIATYDGEKIFELDIGGGEDLRAIDQIGDPAVDMINQRLKDIRFDAEAGPHTVAVTFLHRSFAEHEGLLSPIRPGGGNNNIIRLNSFEILGPYDPTGVSPTPARNKIFTCYPEDASQEADCAREIIHDTARLAFRGDVTDGDMEELMGVWEQASASEGFDLSIRRALTAILASPKFLYRTEPTPADAEPGAAYPLTDLELASRLSFFLWSTLPDDELLSVAEEGRLTEPKVLEAQVRRMLADPKSETLASNFAHQWLHIPHLGEVDPDPMIFADVPGNIRELFVQEIHMFVDDVFRNDQPVTDLLTADYTFANEDLALHYDMTDVKGDRFRKVTLDNPARYGLLGKGAILMSAAYPNRTSPVLRGAYVLENIMGTPPAAPPPNVEAFPETKEGEKPLTVRERLVAHRANPSCNSCHGIMDPLGFVLENFDATGRWREMDRFARTAIDSSAVMPNGDPLADPIQLREALMERPDQFVQTITQKLMMYATGRVLDYRDMPRVREIVHAAAEDDYHFSSVILGVVNSDQFTMKAAADAEEVQEASLQ